MKSCAWIDKSVMAICGIGLLLTGPSARAFGSEKAWTDQYLVTGHQYHVESEDMVSMRRDARSGHAGSRATGCDRMERQTKRDRSHHRARVHRHGVASADEGVGHRRSEKAVEIFEKHGRLKCFDNGELIVELEDEAALAALQAEVTAHLGDQCDVELIPKRN